MKIYKNPDRSLLLELLERPTKTVNNIEQTVDEIFNDVKKYGNQSLLSYTSKFDGVVLESLVVRADEINKASSRVSPELKSAIQLAKSNIETFHKAQKSERVKVDTMGGVECWQEKRPIQKVGLYIPGGTANIKTVENKGAVPPGM